MYDCTYYMYVSGCAYYLAPMIAFSPFRRFALEHELITPSLDPYIL